MNSLDLFSDTDVSFKKEAEIPVGSSPLRRQQRPGVEFFVFLCVFYKYFSQFLLSLGFFDENLEVVFGLTCCLKNNDLGVVCSSFFLM